jgi:acyl-CoA dehydrogenase/citronellyl-CoA dehydrogenase
MAWELDDEHRQAVGRSFVDREVRRLVEAAEAAGKFPARRWKAMGAAGLLGLVTPAEHGGGDGDGPRRTGRGERGGESAVTADVLVPAEAES